MSSTASDTVLDLGTVREADLSRTPCFVTDLAVVRARVDQLRNALPPRSNLYYSVKANPMAPMLEAVAATRCGVEVTSLGELTAAVQAQIQADRILVVGPAKSDELLARCVELGVGTLVVESTGELERLRGIVGDRSVDVAIRLDVPGAKGSLRMSGYQFGADREAAEQCRRSIVANPGFRFAGYHAYLASQLLKVDDIVHNAEIALAQARALHEPGSPPPPMIDLGGGFGIPYGEADEALDLVALRDGLARVIADHEPPSQIAFESGRYLAGPAGALVTRVIDVKETPNGRFVLLDGGTNTSGLFGAAAGMRRPRMTTLRDGVVLPGGEPSAICGPLCTPMDRLATAVTTAARPGDLIVWWNMGAYGRTAAPTDFLSFAPPSEVVVDSGRPGPTAPEPVGDAP